MSAPLECRIEDPVDVMFRVEGDVLRDGHEYHLYSAVKQVVPDLCALPDLWIGRIEQLERGRIGRSRYCRVTRNSRLRIRTSTPLAKELIRLSGEELRVGSALVRLGAISFEIPAPSSRMWCPLVAMRRREPGAGRADNGRDKPSMGVFAGALYDWLRRRHGIEGSQVEIGKRRGFVVGRHGEQEGHAVEISRLTTEQSSALIREGVGARRNMGCGMFLPGSAPRSLRGRGC